MGWQVIWSDESLSNLKALVDYIAQDDPEVAVRYADALIDNVVTLADFPHKGTVYRTLETRTVRKLSNPPYRVFYQLDEPCQRVEVLSVRHAAMDEPEFGENP